MFDLVANYMIKVSGKDNLSYQTNKEERTFFLCVKAEIFKEVLELYPKSKLVCQKRALERRKVFIDHY